MTVAAPMRAIRSVHWLHQVLQSSTVSNATTKKIVKYGTPRGKPIDAADNWITNNEFCDEMVQSASSAASQTNESIRNQLNHTNRAIQELQKSVRDMDALVKDMI